MVRKVISDLKESILALKEKFIININYFIISYFLSVLLYQFFINNLLINTEDSMGTPTFSMGGAWNITLGRYLSAVLQVVFMGISAEPINTMIAMFILCISIFIVFSIFEENKLLMVLSVIMIVSSPIVYYIFSHRYSSVAALLQVFFSVLAVYGIICYKFFISKIVLSTIFIIISLALGQYSIGVIALIFIIYCVKILIFDNAKISDILKLSYHFAIVFILGLVLYRLSWNVCMRIVNVHTTSYSGASDISMLNIILMFPKALINSYLIIIDFLSGRIIKYNIFGAYFINYLFLIFALISLIIYICNKFKSIIISVIICLAMLVLIPPILSITIFLTPAYQYIRPHQMIAFAFLFPLMILILKRIFYSKDNNLSCINKVKPILLIFAVILLHSQMMQMSVDFDTMYRSKNSLQNISMLILNKLENKNLLDSKKNYYIYGNFFDNELYYIQDYKDRYTNIDKVNYRFAVGNVNTNDWWGQFLKTEFIREYMGINLFKDTPHEKYSSYYDTEEFKSIKPFPSDESIFEIDENDVIIKVSN